MLEWWSKRSSSSSHHKHAAVRTQEDDDDDDDHLWRVIQASDSKKERKAKLHHSYERNACIMKLEARHIMLRDHQNEDEDDEGEEEDLAQGVVVIPRPKQRPQHSNIISSQSESPLLRSKQNDHSDNDSSSNEHEEEQEEATTTKSETTCSTHVPNCCIICLEHYRPGDTLVWSHHVDCPHAFHRKCVTKYLVKMMQRRRNASTPCPVCRRPFTDLEVEPRTKRRRRRQRTATERRRRSEEESASSSRVCEWWTRVVSFFCR